MSDVNWWLIALAFLLGLVLTFLLTVRRVKLEVPVYGALGRGPTASGAADTSATAKLPTADTEATGKLPRTAVARAAAAAAGGAAAAKFAGGRSGAEADTAKISRVGDEPYGAGSLRVAATADAPSGYTIKGNEDSMPYHSPESPFYDAAIAKIWFRDAESAERAGFARWDKGDGVSGKVAAGAAAAGTSTLGSWLLATWVAVAMVVILPASLVHVSPAPKSVSWLLALVITTVAGFRFSWIVADGRRRLYELSFWVFTYVFLGIAPLVQLRTGEAPSTTPRIDTTLNQAAMVVGIVGIVAFVIGLSIPGLRVASGAPNFLRGAYAVNGVDLGRAVALAVFALCIDTYFIAKVGIGPMFSNRQDVSNAINSAWTETSVSALVVCVTTMTLLVSFIALVKCVKQKNRHEWPLIALTVLVGLVLAITVNPITSPRYIFGTVALSVAALFGLVATPRLFRLTAILWVIALIVVFPFADAFRYSSTPSFKSSSVLESLTSPDFDAFAQLSNTLLYVERHGLTRGRQAAGVALFWVPRRVWPDKPRDTGILLAQSRGYSAENLSAPMWAEMYINGGWPLLVVGMLGLGIVVRSQDKRIEESIRRARAPSILACILPFYLTILLRGSLLQAMSYLLVVLSCTVFVSRWQRVASR